MGTVELRAQEQGLLILQDMLSENNLHMFIMVTDNLSNSHLGGVIGCSAVFGSSFHSDRNMGSEMTAQQQREKPLHWVVCCNHN